MKTPPADTFTVGIIYVKPLEMMATIVMLDERYDSIPGAHGDQNDYTLGRIGDHNVAIVGPGRGEQGTVTTAQFVSTIQTTFPNISIGLLVGIGGGIPHYPEPDIRLGDVVVGAPESGPAVVQYDLGKRTTEGFEVTRSLAEPPKVLLQVVNKVHANSMIRRDGEDAIIKPHLDRFSTYPMLRRDFQKPSSPDRLFQSAYIHQQDTACTEHDEQFEIVRHLREPDEIAIHYSSILSGNSVMKSAKDRDLLSKQHNNALCIEMEAAGLMDVFPCLVIRGICDYADSHKNDAWQKYAAATAAAYAREILLNLSKQAQRYPAFFQSEQDQPTDSQGRFRAFFSTHNNSGVQVGQNYSTMNNTFGRM